MEQHELNTADFENEIGEIRRVSQVRAGLYIVKLVNKPIQSNEFHSIMDDLYQSIISH